ncbi:hypothetical protein [Litorisediminicola beolgyonensis]|uniref:Uncharacterized protein n=1 Tax=Litorisediminicola beolgyonensis TaxID=1173614 RepID=A0ABW3ZJE7_9RHOB
MKILVSPVAALPGTPETTVTVQDTDTLVVDGTLYNLESIPEGGRGIPEGDHPFAGPITRAGGELTVPLRFLYDGSTAEPNQPSDPAAWLHTVAVGPLPDPITRRAEPDAEATEEAA